MSGEAIPTRSGPLLRYPEREPFRLAGFCFDAGIGVSHVLLIDSEATGGELERMPRDDALAIARSRGVHLVVESWTVSQSMHDNSISPGEPVCFIGPVAVPVRWEELPDEPDEVTRLDERLWFDAPCGGRDLLMDGSGHTFRGRMNAWCPAKREAYNISLGEMGEMSDEARYFVLGFLSGSEPPDPNDLDGEGEVAADDLAAWLSSNRRFRRTGYWRGGWHTCNECGCVLLPDTFSDYCHAHRSADETVQKPVGTQDLPRRPRERRGWR